MDFPFICMRTKCIYRALHVESDEIYPNRLTGV